MAQRYRAGMLLDRLFPRPGQIEAGEALAHLDLGSRAPAGRPYVVLNMVATLDGKAAVDGTTRGLGGEADRELFHTLRTQADAILVGAGTAREERYGRAVKDPQRRAQREREGLDPEPIVVIVSSRLNLPPDLPLLQEKGARVVIATAAGRELEGVAADVTYTRSGDDLPMLFARLREDHGVRSVLCEGGPTLNAHLLAAGLVDELFMSIDPFIVGGEQALTIVGGRPLHQPVKAELLSLLHGAEGLYGRWRLASA